MTPDELRRALLELALSRLADSDEETPDAEASDEADLILARLEEPAFSELLQSLSQE